MRVLAPAVTSLDGSEYGKLTAQYDATGDTRLREMFRLLADPRADRPALISTLANVYTHDELPELPLPGKIGPYGVDLSIRHKGNDGVAQVVNLVPQGRQYSELIWGASGYSHATRTPNGTTVRQLHYRPQDGERPYRLDAREYDGKGVLRAMTILRDFGGEESEHNNAVVVTRIDTGESDDVPLYAKAHYSSRVNYSTSLSFMGDEANAEFERIRRPKKAGQLTTDVLVEVGFLDGYPIGGEPNMNHDRDATRLPSIDITGVLLSSGIESGPGYVVAPARERPRGVTPIGSDAIEITASTGRLVLPMIFDTAAIRAEMSF